MKYVDGNEVDGNGRILDENYGHGGPLGKYGDYCDEPVAPAAPAGAREWYVITTTGDGAQAFIATGEEMPSVLHNLYCCCENPTCALDQVVWARESFVNLGADEWSTDWPDEKPTRWSDDGEDYSVTITRMTKLHSSMSQAEKLRGLGQEAAEKLWREGQIWASSREDVAAIIDQVKAGRLKK